MSFSRTPAGASPRKRPAKPQLSQVVPSLKDEHVDRVSRHQQCSPCACLPNSVLLAQPIPVISDLITFTFAPSDSEMLSSKFGKRFCSGLERGMLA